MHNRNSHWDIIMKRKGEKVIRAPLKDIFDRKCRNKSTIIWKNKIWKGINAYYRLNNDIQCYLSSISVCGQVMTRNCPVYNKLFIRFLCKCTFCHRDTWRELGAMIWSISCTLFRKMTTLFTWCPPVGHRLWLTVVFILLTVTIWKSRRQDLGCIYFLAHSAQTSFPSARISIVPLHIWLSFYTKRTHNHMVPPPTSRDKA